MRLLLSSIALMILSSHVAVAANYQTVANSVDTVIELLRDNDLINETNGIGIGIGNGPEDYSVAINTKTKGGERKILRFFRDLERPLEVEIRVETVGKVYAFSEQLNWLLSKIFFFLH